jgi:hypothetical protein
MWVPCPGSSSTSGQSSLRAWPPAAADLHAGLLQPLDSLTFSRRWPPRQPHAPPTSMPAVANLVPSPPPTHVVVGSRGPPATSCELDSATDRELAASRARVRSGKSQPWPAGSAGGPGTRGAAGRGQCWRPRHERRHRPIEPRAAAQTKVEDDPSRGPHTVSCGEKKWMGWGKGRIVLSLVLEKECVKEIFEMVKIGWKPPNRRVRVPRG